MVSGDLVMEIPTPASAELLTDLLGLVGHRCERIVVDASVGTVRFECHGWHSSAAPAGLVPAGHESSTPAGHPQGSPASTNGASSTDGASSADGAGPAVRRARTAAARVGVRRLLELLHADGGELVDVDGRCVVVLQEALEHSSAQTTRALLAKAERAGLIDRDGARGRATRRVALTAAGLAELDDEGVVEAPPELTDPLARLHAAAGIAPPDDEDLEPDGLDRDTRGSEGDAGELDPGASSTPPPVGAVVGQADRSEVHERRRAAAASALYIDGGP